MPPLRAPRPPNHCARFGRRSALRCPSGQRCCARAACRTAGSGRLARQICGNHCAGRLPRR
eukprot:14823706-Alexandrium_andersonii.AAC.1